MAILLYRVDERLIHGQVVVGWGSQLRPDRYVVVDDGLAESPWEQELYLLGLPAGIETVFVTAHEARAGLERWEEDPTRTILLTRDLTTMLALARDGGLEGRPVNVGGIHHSAGREEVLPYLYLNGEDRRRLRELAEAGAEVTAQDLPGSRRIPLEELLE